MANGPDTTSSDYDAMKPYWDMSDTLLGGAGAMRAAGQTYLPKFPNETQADYDYRRANAKFTNIFADIVANLASKPFSEEVALNDGANARFVSMSEDIDGRGNNLHVFAASAFYRGIANAIDWILVDYTKARPRADGQALSLEDERSQGLRPYWVHVPATRMLAVYTDVINGVEAFVHARILETATERVEFGETCVERVRVLDRQPIFEIGPDGEASDKVIGYAPATFTIYEKRAARRRGGAPQWMVIDSGPITIGVIALVPFVTGRRIDGSWQFVPPMQDVANLQVEHYQAETGLKSIKELTAFPMLAGNGVAPAMQDGAPAAVPVGPRSVLYAPPFGEGATHGEWKFIEPGAESLKFLAADVEAIEKQMREIGRQPLTATAGITVVTAALASQKASSAVQAWAYGLKDALEQAFVYTAKWLGIADSPEVTVYTDFALETGDSEGPTTLLSLREKGDLSRATTWAEMKRRGILSGDFDATAEEKALEDEAPDPDTIDEQTAALPGPRLVA